MDKVTYVQHIQAHSGMMYRIALTILGNNEDCQDALQEAALKAWEKRNSLREEKFFATWLTRILINACYTIRRKKRKFVLMAQLPDQPQPPEDPTLFMVLETLPEKYRLPLVLRFSEGMDEAQIARVLHVPQSTVRGRIHRAKQKLRQELEK